MIDGQRRTAEQQRTGAEDGGTEGQEQQTRTRAERTESGEAERLTAAGEEGRKDGKRNGSENKTNKKGLKPQQSGTYKRFFEILREFLIFFQSIRGKKSKSEE